MKHDSRETLADITLLFELSLAVGASLDLAENCRRFLTTLMARKNLDLAAVWLRPADRPPEDRRYHLAYAAPDAHVGVRVVDAGPALVDKLEGDRGFRVAPDAPEVVGLFARGDRTGTCAVFPLAGRGFLALHSSFDGAFGDGRELRQLEGVVAKFAVSIEGCFAHAQAIREIAERKKSEAARARIREQLHQAQKMDAVGRLAGGVAHDFNNLLTGILGCAELLERMSESEEQRALTRLIVGASQSAAELTGQLLTFSHRGGSEKRSVVVDELTSQTVLLLRRTLGPEITLRSELGLGPRGTVLASPSALSNALLNLGVNARDAIDGEGTIDVSTDRVLLDDAFCLRHGGAIPPGDYARIRVADTGVGMDPETSARVFEPFFTTKSSGRGTGLGLATAYGTVTGLGGLITLETRRRVGSTFDIYLPLSDDGELSAAPEVSVAPGPGAGKILLVDDDDHVRWVLERTGRSLGYEVIAVSAAAPALRALVDDRPDVVLLDVRLGGVSGPEVLSEIRKTHPDLPVVAITGFADQRDLERLEELGLDGFLDKPFTRAALAKALAAAMKRTG